MGLISEKMKFDFLVRLKFDISEGYDKAGIKTAYNDFARTLRTDNLKEKKSKTEKFLLKELKELISFFSKSNFFYDAVNGNMEIFSIFLNVCYFISTEKKPIFEGHIYPFLNLTITKLIPFFLKFLT